MATSWRGVDIDDVVDRIDETFAQFAGVIDGVAQPAREPLRTPRGRAATMGLPFEGRVGSQRRRDSRGRKDERHPPLSRWRA